MDGQPITFAGSRAAEARTAHQGREWRSAAPHFDRRFPASLRRDLVTLCAPPQTPRRLRCRAGNSACLRFYGRRQLLWFAVTRHPTAEWLARQIVEAFPWEASIVRRR
jgi:hypothetical protein